MADATDINFAEKPYNDDYDEIKGFLKILFRSGVALQARELNQIQSILQDQIKRLGQFSVANGEPLSGGKLSIMSSTNESEALLAYHVKISSANTDLASFVNKELTGQTSGVKAKVIHYAEAEGSDPATLFVSYTSGGGKDADNFAFADGEVITDGTVSATTQDSDATGPCAIATIESGVYFVDGYMVRIEQQSAIFSKYTANSSGRVGLQVNRELITEADDPSLLDNAQGTSNYLAPGAHRYKITLTLVVRNIDVEDGERDFLPLAFLKTGEIQQIITYPNSEVKAPLLQQMLAERTFDESGSYTVTPFIAEVREHLNTILDASGKPGKFTAEEGGDRNKLAVVLSPGKAYVDGYPIQKTGPSTVAIDKARAYETVEGGAVGQRSTDYGNFVYITTPFGLPEINKFGDNVGEMYPEIQLRDDDIVVVSGNCQVFSGSASVYDPINKTLSISTSSVNDIFNGGVIRLTDGTGAGQTRTITDFETSTNNNVTVSVGFTTTPDTTTRYEIWSEIPERGGNGIVGGQVIGTARIRDIVKDTDLSGEIHDIYRLYLFDIKMNGSKKLDAVKSFSMKNGSPSTCRGNILNEVFLRNFRGADFTLDQPLVVKKSDGYFVYGVPYVWENASRRLLIQDVSPERDSSSTSTFEVNDIVREPVVFNSATIANTALYTYTDSEGTVYEKFKLKQQESNRLLFELPESAIRDVDGVAITAVRRTYSGVLDASGSVEFNLTETGETFYLNEDYYITSLVSGEGIYGIVDEDLVDYQILEDGTKLVVTLLSSNHNAENNVINVMALISKGVPKLKRKTRNTVTRTFTTENEVKKPRIPLDRADIIRIQSIRMSTGFGVYEEAGSIDITENYTLDNGQRDNYYGIGALVLKSGEKYPSGTIQVIFDHWKHEAGDYFCVRSYPTPSDDTDAGPTQIEYRDITQYISPDSGYAVRLTDVYDFRPTMGTGDSFSVQNGASRLELPSPIGTVNCNRFEYYLNRIDKIYLDPAEKAFKVISSAPSIQPLPPADPDRGMVVYTVYVNAYTHSTEDAVPVFVENRRYTMRDIGRLEKRIDNLEYYTTLSLLEKETADLQVTDSDGLPRYKNGFVVDTFNGHGIGNVQDPDYAAAMDTEKGELRPIFTQNNCGIEFDAAETLAEGTTDSEYAETDDLLMLPYSHEIAIQNPLASKTENVNPYDVATFVGSIALDPPNDDWKDTLRRPDIISNINGQFDAARFISDAGLASGTVWNDWETTWSGVINTRTTTQRQTEVAENARRRNSSGQLFPFRRNTIETRVVTSEQRQSRTGTQTNIVNREIQTNLGDRVVNVALAPTIRSRTLTFRATRLKPNTRVYPFFDGVAVSSYVTPAALITNEFGEVSGTFTIPNTDTLNFKTGDRIFRLTDDPRNGNSVRTSAEATYHAQGLIQTVEAQIISTRVPEVVRTTVTENRSTTSTDVFTSTRTGPWQDPLAQTIMITNPGGAFITKIDLFFKTKAASLPITLQIRNTINGYPGPMILPFSEVTLNPTSVNISDDASAATTFEFSSPVYLQDNTEYAIVLISNSNEYEAYVSQVGERMIGTDTMISSQPYLGSLFKSQNASTWTAEQLEDLKFTVYRAKFDTSKAPNLIFKNSTLPKMLLNTNPLYTKAGESKIRVFAQNHGLVDGDTTTIENAASTNSIEADWINGAREVTRADFDTFIIASKDSAVALTEGYGGGDTVEITRSYQMDMGRFMVQQVILPDTLINWQYRTAAYSTHALGVWTNADVNTNIPFSEPMYISSAAENIAGGKSVVLKAHLESALDNVSPVIDKKRMSILAVGNRVNNPSLIDDNDDDLDVITIVSESSNIRFQTADSITIPAGYAQFYGNINASANVVLSNISSNTANIFASLTANTKININTTGTVDNLYKGLLIKEIAGSANVLYTAQTNFNNAFTSAEVGVVTITRVDNDNMLSSPNAAVSALLGRIQPNKYIEISGSANSENNGLFLVKSVTSNNEVVIDGKYQTGADFVFEDSSAPITIQLHDKFKSDTGNRGGSASAKYITRQILLSSPADSIKVFLTVNKPVGTYIDVYYKTQRVNDAEAFGELAYVPFNTTGAPDNEIEASRNASDFAEYEYTVENIDPFTAFAIKIVMRSDSTVNVPRIKDLRAIALS